MEGAKYVFVSVMLNTLYPILRKEESKPKQLGEILVPFFMKVPRTDSVFPLNTINQPKIRRGNCHKIITPFPCLLNKIPFDLG